MLPIDVQYSQNLFSQARREVKQDLSLLQKLQQSTTGTIFGNQKPETMRDLARIDSVENHVFEESSRINSTWGGNLVDFVRATKYLEIIEKYDLPSQVPFPFLFYCIA